MGGGLGKRACGWVGGLENVKIVNEREHLWWIHLDLE